MHPTVKGTFPAVIDSTSRGDLASCETKAYWGFNRKLGPKEGSVHLVAGGAFARGLEVTRLRHFGDKLPLPEALHEGMLAAIAEYGAFVTPEDKSVKGVDRVVQALDYYFNEAFPPATDHVKPMYTPDGKPMVEFTFAIPLPVMHPDSGEPLIYAGRFDMVGLYNDQIFCVDEKTTTQLGPTWPAQWNLRGQFTGYSWACQQYGKPAVGAIVRGISFLKNSFGKSESLQQRPQWMIDQWYEQLIKDVQRWKQAYVSGWYHQNFGDACGSWGGCAFQSLCGSANPEAWIEGKYKTREWDPLQKVPYKQVQSETEIIDVPDDLKALIR